MVGGNKEIRNIFPVSEKQASDKESGLGFEVSAAEQGGDTANPRIGDIEWPQLPSSNAMLQIPSFTKRDVLESHGGSAFQKKRTRELARERKGSVRHAMRSREVQPPFDEKDHLPI